jgi:tetratricopeptide (TPR) repeat protein
MFIREKQAPNTITLAKSYNNIGMLYRTLGNFGEALQYYNKAMDIKKEKDLGSISYATTLNNIGFVYCEMGNFEKAL